MRLIVAAARIINGESLKHFFELIFVGQEKPMFSIMPVPCVLVSCVIFLMKRGGFLRNTKTHPCNHFSDKRQQGPFS